MYRFKKAPLYHQSFEGLFYCLVPSCANVSRRREKSPVKKSQTGLKNPVKNTLLAKRKKTSTPTPSKGLSDVKEFASEKKNTGETKLRKVFHDRLDVLYKTVRKRKPRQKRGCLRV